EWQERVILIQKGQEQVQKTQENADAVKRSINKLEKGTPTAPDYGSAPKKAKGKWTCTREWGEAELSNGEMSEEEQELCYTLATSGKEVSQRQERTENIDKTHQKHQNMKHGHYTKPNTSKTPVKKTEQTARETSRGTSDDSDAKVATTRLKELETEIRSLIERLRENQKREKVDHCERSSTEPMSRKMNDLIERAASQGPAQCNKQLSSSEQMEKHTLIGQLFEDIGKAHRGQRNGRQPKDPDPSSSNSSSNSEQRGPQGDDKDSHKAHKGIREDMGVGYSGEDEHDGGYTTLRPTAPKKYDGSADMVKFYQFVNQGSQYLKRGRILTWNQIPELSNFLKGKAYEFYLNKVSMELEEWDVLMFFRELFNACFPPNFRMDQQQKLEMCKQGTLTVWEYAARLKMFYRIVGYAHKREKTRKLWRGFVPRIRQHLYRMGHDPEHSA
ncbi:hypothetical protein C0991_005082, partial [Blastosporella zonata]